MSDPWKRPDPDLGPPVEIEIPEPPDEDRIYEAWRDEKWEKSQEYPPF